MLESDELNYPIVIESRLTTNSANDRLNIIIDEFIIKYNNEEIHCKGSFFFVWTPQPRIIFEGKYDISNTIINGIVSSGKPFEVWLDKSLFGNGRYTLIKGGIIEGEIYDHGILGDASIIVEEVNFNIPNLRHFHGEYLTTPNELYHSNWSGRLTFENEKYIIKIDYLKHSFKLKEELKKSGGYAILYNGNLVPKSGVVSFLEAEELLFCFGIFLSFLNGKRVSAIFPTGIFGGEEKWIDYAPKLNTYFRGSSSWPTQHNTEGFNALWVHFYQLWFEQNEKRSLLNLVRWYNEVNNSKLAYEARLIMAQATLELIFNWWIVEDLKIIKGKDAENLSASNKIRMILSQSKITFDVPKKLKGLRELVKQSNNSIEDGPDVLVYLRNAFVHSNKTKRVQIGSKPIEPKLESISLALWYIELSILNMLGYKGVYRNRLSENVFAHQKEQRVPWVIPSN